MVRSFVFSLSMLMTAPVWVQAAEVNGKQAHEEVELRALLGQLKAGDLSKAQVFERLDKLVDQDAYKTYLGPHIMLASMSDLYAPQSSERIFRRALASLEGKQFVIFMMRYFDRAMELDRNYIYDEERIQTDPDYREFWDNRQFYDFTVSEFDALADCHEIFSEQNEWRESALAKEVAAKPCSILKDF